MRFLQALLVLVAVAFAWLKVVAMIDIWWLLRHPSAIPSETETYFITSNRLFWLAVILPVCLFAFWLWRRVFGRTT